MKTEAEAWLKIARKCVRIRTKAVFLCLEAKDVTPLMLSAQMCRRLELFQPAPWSPSNSLWWCSILAGSNRADVNDQRALACCFLAAIAGEEEE